MIHWFDNKTELHVQLYIQHSQSEDRIISLLTPYFCAFQWLPESCRYYLAAGEKEKAIRMLQRVARVNKTEMPVGTLQDASEVSNETTVNQQLSCEIARIIA